MINNQSIISNHYPVEGKADLCVNNIVNILAKSKLFPLSFEKIYKQISKEFTTQKKKTVEFAIQKLIYDKKIVSIVSERGTLYFSKENEIIALNNLKSILQDYHKQFPCKAGVTKSQIREFFANNKKKKKQKSICPSLLIHIIDLAFKQQQINIINNYLSLSEFRPEIESIEENLAILIGLIRDNFNFKRSDKKEFAEKMSMTTTEIKKLINVLKQKRLIFEISDNLLIDHDNLQKLKVVVHDKIVKDGPAHIKDFTEILNQSRSSLIPFFDFLDNIYFTQRVGDKRVLVNS